MEPIEWKGYKVKNVCLICGEEVQSEELRKHRMAHIRNGDVWSAPCKLDDYGNGLCLKKEHYDGCVCTTNWMCFRDGLMIQNDDAQPAMVVHPNSGGRSIR